MTGVAKLAAILACVSIGACVGQTQFRYQPMETAALTSELSRQAQPGQNVYEAGKLAVCRADGAGFVIFEPRLEGDKLCGQADTRGGFGEACFPVSEFETFGAPYRASTVGVSSYSIDSPKC